MPSKNLKRNVCGLLTITFKHYKMQLHVLDDVLLKNNKFMKIKEEKMDLQETIKEKGRLFMSEEVPDEYLTDPYIEEIPDVYAVALPTRHEEVVELVKFAKEKELTIIARGAGT